MSIPRPFQCPPLRCHQDQLRVPRLLPFPLLLVGLSSPSHEAERPVSLFLPHPSLSFPPVQHSENRRELMFILVTPMSLRGVERLKELTRGKSQKRSASSSLSSSS